MAGDEREIDTPHPSPHALSYRNQNRHGGSIIRCTPTFDVLYVQPPSRYKSTDTVGAKAQP